MNHYRVCHFFSLLCVLHNYNSLPHFHGLTTRLNFFLQFDIILLIIFCCFFLFKAHKVDGKYLLFQSRLHKKTCFSSSLLFPFSPPLFFFLFSLSLCSVSLMYSFNEAKRTDGDSLT